MHRHMVGDTANVERWGHRHMAGDTVSVERWGAHTYVGGYSECRDGGTDIWWGRQ